MNKTESQLTECATINLELNSREFFRRVRLGLATQKRLSPIDQIQNYLEAVGRINPDIDKLTSRLARDINPSTFPELVICIPAVGFANQEQGDLKRTLRLLMADPLIQKGKAAALILVNRPQGEIPDDTAGTARQSVKSAKNIFVIESEIPQSLGNTTGPFASEMANDPNDVPIALIRDLLAITAIKTYPSTQEPPVILQMDADFTGFKSGNLTTISNYFAAYPDLDFLQCTSDWDSPDTPTETMPALFVGSELMRELPQILKRQLRNSQLPDTVLQQIIFGEAIQRGIQVPQAERMESIAQKGGYGLNRLKEDELDTNLRTTAICRGLRSLASTDQVIFNWSNRRALASWSQYQKPPISQWQTPFVAFDPVRNSETIITDTSDMIAVAVRCTLERFPLPSSLPGIYENFATAILGITDRYYPSEEFQILDLGTGNFALQL